MTTLQLNAELYRAMGEIARNGWAAAAKQAHADGEDKLMAADVFEDITFALQ